MKKIWGILLALALFALGTAVMAEGAVLTVRGTGVVSLEADTATITLGVREMAKDVATAQSAVNEKMASVVDKLTEMGIAMSDIHTSSISIYPEYNYEEANNPVIGYTAENTISARTGDTENVGRYIDAAFDAGANTFSDISFSASDSKQENNEALALAIQHACSKAEAMAEAAGGKLGALISISEADYSYADNGAYYAKEAAADTGAGTAVYASPLEVSATVTMQFEIEAQ